MTAPAGPALPPAVRREPTASEIAIVEQMVRARTGWVASALSERREVVGMMIVGAAVCGWMVATSPKDRLPAALFGGLLLMLAAIGIFKRRGLRRAKLAADLELRDSCRWVEQFDFDVSSITVASDLHDGFDWWRIELASGDVLVLNEELCPLPVERPASRLHVVVNQARDVVSVRFSGDPIVVVDRTSGPDAAYWPEEDGSTQVGPFWFAASNLELVRRSDADHP